LDGAASGLAVAFVPEMGVLASLEIAEDSFYYLQVMKVLVKNLMLNEIYGIYIYLTITNSGITNPPFLILYFKSRFQIAITNLLMTIHAEI